MSEPTLTHAHFPAFFKAVWGFDPFPWQADLLTRLATGEDARRTFAGRPGEWPAVLDLPTGSGKTAALDIALFHLALEADKGERRRAPVRIAFVVDRRLIVDDAFARAEWLADVLAWSLMGTEEAERLRAELEADAHRAHLGDVLRRVQAEPIVRRVASRLCNLAGPKQPPMVARRLRGGAPREDDWARTPVQPTILCSTVDQVGSRLLFRGYGVTDRMKPIHAGLLGSDCLILLDEAHLSKPFRQTLEAVRSLRGGDEARAPFGFAVLTATPDAEAKTRFGLTDRDHADPILSARISAEKPARLVAIESRQGVDPEARRVEGVADWTRNLLAELSAAGVATPALGVVVNRVARARAVFGRLKAELQESANVTLIIGPARSVDREDRAAELDSIRTRSPGAPRGLPKPLIVVATQTIEAGVDIDFDGLVTEAAALDALRQRFGRLNRAGRRIAAKAAILAYKADVGAKADDPVYGDRIAKTWAKLKQLAPGPDGRVDFGIAALRQQIGEEEAGTLAAPASDAPVLLPAYARLWSQTWPIPNADPSVALFLHGPDRSSKSVQIVWRADIDEQHDLRPAMGESESAKAAQNRLVELLKLVPPRAAEAIEVPLWAARAWLNRPERGQADFSDSIEQEQDADVATTAARRAFRWEGENGERTGVIYASSLENGDLIVVPSSYGGCDKWGWHPQRQEPVVDVAERAAEPYRARRFAVRVTPTLVAQQSGTTVPAIDQAAISEELAKLLADHEGRRADDILEAVLNYPMLPDTMQESLQRLKRPRGKVPEQQERRRGPLEAELDLYRRDASDRPGGIIFAAPRGLDIDNDARNEAAVPATEGDDLGAAAGQAVLLTDHSGHVREWARAFAERAGLPSAVCEDVALSGYLHDPGKADERWQAYAVGGDPYGPDSADTLAKPAQRPSRGAWDRAGLPPNWRHEALSVRMTMSHPDIVQAHARTRDRALVLWLIGTHHGYGRPLFPHADPLDKQPRSIELPRSLGGPVELASIPGPQSLAFDFEGKDWAQLFEALKEKYGIWGLARLEAFVRLADHRASEAVGPPAAARDCKEVEE
jgi:CRISPR-associated endonuclease/helicase Cas3